MVQKAQTNAQTAQNIQSARPAYNSAVTRNLLKAAPGLAASGPTSDVGPISNTGNLSDPSDSKQRYTADSWTLEVTMKNGGDLLDKNGNKIGTFTINDNTWSVTLAGANFDDLTANDGENRYYYYIDSVNEKNVPEGTTPSIDNETNGERKLYSEADKDTGKKLSVTNNLIVADKSITIVKYSKGTTTPLSGAKFTLTEVDDQGRDVTGGYTSGEISVDQTGTITFAGLKPGVYRLEETVVPAGYVKKEGPYYIVINNDGSSSVQTELTVSHTLINKDVASGSFIIENEPGAALPHTGGIGTTIFYILGSILVIGGGIYFVSRRRMK